MDIIFFAAVAFFIFFKLFKQLGKIDQDEKKQIEEKLALKKKEILAMQKQVVEQLKKQNVIPSNSEMQASNEILNSLDESTKQNFIKILQSCKISADFFVKGAKSAFEMIIKAFSAGDLKDVKTLLSEKIYQGFDSAIMNRKSEGKTLTTNLIAIEKAEIISAAIISNMASVVVKFTSQQINYISDKEGNLVEGSKDEIVQLNDIWTFKKDITSPNPNWVVYTTANS